jgi:uncharacterized membrane protein
VVIRNVLLSIHILAVVVWLGCGLYELVLTREIHRARGSAEEIPLLRIYGRYAGIVAIATLVTAAAGVSMSLMLGWGFFSVLWLGIKQGIMAANGSSDRGVVASVSQGGSRRLRPISR